MALLGTGAICIWNGITEDGRADFYAWHLEEHMPERVAIPGFLRGRRYRALDDGTNPEFFTLYETADPAVMTSAAYLARLNDPTPWTKRTTQGFRDTSRALTRVLASHSLGDGGTLATLRLPVRAGAEEAFAAALDATALRRLRGPRISALHVCSTMRDASAARTAESRERTDILAAPDWIALVEGCDGAAAREATLALADLAGPFLDGASIIGIYGLEHTSLKA
jgi:hypothetical protein